VYGTEVKEFFLPLHEIKRTWPRMKARKAEDWIENLPITPQYRIQIL
jgi:hypothetical protein